MVASLKAQTQDRSSFDAGWRFHLGDLTGAQQLQMNDADWKAVDLPHDWAIAGPFEPSNPSGGAGAFASAGVGWYRKHFTLPSSTVGRRVFIVFDGVMANSDVWINGVLLGHRPYGYVSFQYELTDHFHAGQDNVIAVRADNSQQPSSRWYEGAGIYRHVHLLVKDAAHLETWATFVSTPEVSADSATVKVQTSALNQGATLVPLQLRVTLLDSQGHAKAKDTDPVQQIGAAQHGRFELSLHVTSPARWDIDHPQLYRARVELLAGKKVVDTETIPFGIREFHFDANTGFWLNGRNFKLNGVALHSDVGSLGMAAPLGLWEHRLLAMRKMGANAIRTAHNPVAPEFLDLCDRMGFLVMDEFFDQWTVAKNKYDYHLYFQDQHLRDLEDSVKRDRNHPSIILYSAGNEIHDTPNGELAKSILGPMVALYHATDPTRPVTQALFRPNVSHDYQNGLADMLDVVGQNYRPNEILAAHAEKPTRKIVGTENIHDLGTWLAVRDHPAYSGMFIWAGTDYLGESRHWPLIGDASGMNDRTDAPKPDSLEREAWWSDHPVVHVVRRTASTPLAPTDPGYELEQFRPKQVLYNDWSPKDRGPHDEAVEVYSNCDEVELLLNGKSLGVKPRNADDSSRRWSVPFSAGALQAVGRNRGVQVQQETLHTADASARIELRVEYAKLGTSFDNVAYLRAYVEDGHGTLVPDATSLLTFSVEGPGEILSTDNADNVYESVFHEPQRHAYHGTAIAIVRAHAASGQLRVHVTSPGLEAGMKTLVIGEKH
jgi:beta-galactosidase